METRKWRRAGRGRKGGVKLKLTFDVLVGPGLKDGENVALVGDGNKHSFGPGGEDVREGDAGLPDGGGVDEGQELVDVCGEQGVKEL